MLPAKRRSVEKRREISRCAARHRREKEADVFTDLYVTVPIVEEPKVTHVDRIAVLRLAASLCRFRQVASKVLTSKLLQNVPLDDKVETDLLADLFSETMLADSLNGFLLVVDSRSSIIYISPNVSRSLGLTQTDLVGQCLNDFLHQDDVAELKQNFAQTDDGNIAKVFLRMKSVLGARGRNLNLRSALYKAISFVMTKRQIDNIGNAAARKAAKEINVANSDNDNDMEDDDENSQLSSEEHHTTAADNNYFFLHGSLISQYGSVETHSAGAFVTRHSMEMKFSYCHDRLSDYLGYDIKSLMGVSFYSLVHPQDITQLNYDFKELYKKGQVNTGIYRLMAKTGGYVWLTTEASVVTQGTRSGRGQHIVCVHQVISAPDTKEVLADVQQNLIVIPAIVTAKVESNRKAPKVEMESATCGALVERAPNVTEVTSLANVPLRNHETFDNWLFRGCWSNAQHAPVGNMEECRSKSSFSGDSIVEDVNSPDRSPPLLLVGNEQPQTYDIQYNTFGFGSADSVSAERTPMLLSADSVGPNGSQSARNTNMYATLLDADLSSAEELTDKLVDLSLLAPFVDTGELVTLDLLAEDLDVPLDFGDFTDLSLDTFTDNKKAKCATLNGCRLTKVDLDPSLASCQLGFNNTYGQHVGKELDWPQIIESLSPMTSSHSEVVHQIYRVAIEHPERNHGSAGETHLGHYERANGYKMEPLDTGSKTHVYLNDNLFGFAHDAALSNKVQHAEKSSSGAIHHHQNFQEAQTHHQHQWQHYKEMSHLQTHGCPEPLNSHNYAQQSHLTKMKSGGGFDVGHGPRHANDGVHHHIAAYHPPHVQHQYKCSTPVFDYERTSQMNHGGHGLKALSTFTHSSANYPQSQPTAPPCTAGAWPNHQDMNNYNPAQSRRCGTAPQTPTQTSNGFQFQKWNHPLTPDLIPFSAASTGSTMFPYPKINHQSNQGNPKKRLHSDSTMRYTNRHQSGKNDVSPCGQFYMNPNVEVNKPPPLLSNLSWPMPHQQGSADRPATAEPKIKRFKASASHQSYIKVGTSYGQVHHSMNHL